MTTILNLKHHHAINPDDIRIGNTRTEIMDFILELDLSMADSDFTEDLIIKLVESVDMESRNTLDRKTVESIRSRVNAILEGSEQTKHETTLI